ncbi:MAG: nitrophenyl compound nitroreductase subunit ArsF family protein [Chitinivibrionales bacterium]|nr:nitrophenyl compound nitroreductase subunit ArsF family protein [Chitinivibrionales bacterium]
MYSYSNAGPAAQKTTAQKKPAVAATNPAKAEQKLIVYYFHGNARCPTCFKLESLAKSVVESDFADGIKKGILEWKTVNVEDKDNEHFTRDYKLYTKSIIISVRQGDKETSFKNLDRIWQLVQNETAYREYIKKEVKACLDGKCL